MFDEDLKFMLSDTFGQTVTIKTGVLMGKKVKGMWDTNHMDRSLGGHPLATEGPIFTIASGDIQGLTADDKIEFDGKEYQLAKITRDSTGMVRVETRETLGGDVIHGDLD